MKQVQVYVYWFQLDKKPPKRLLFCIFSSVDLDWKLRYGYQTKLDFFLVKAVCVYDLCERFPLFLEQFSYYASFQHIKVLLLEYEKSVWGNTVLLVLAFVPPSHPPPPLIIGWTYKILLLFKYKCKLKIMWTFLCWKQLS